MEVQNICNVFNMLFNILYNSCVFNMTDDKYDRYDKYYCILKYLYELDISEVGMSSWLVFYKIKEIANTWWFIQIV